MAAATKRVSNRLLVWVVLVGVGVGGVSLWHMVQEKRRIQQTVSQLRIEQSRLNQELLEAKVTIEHQRGELGALAGELGGVKERLKQVDGELAALQRDYEQLQGEYRLVNGRLNDVSDEKRQLEARLSSLRELRLAIRDVKRKAQQERLAVWREHVEAFQRKDREQLASGNQGYIIRDGSSTIGANSRVQVRVLDPELK